MASLYTWICLIITFIFVTKTVQGHMSLDSAQDDANSEGSSMNTMLLKFLLETLVSDSSDLNDKIDKLEEKFQEQKYKIEEQTEEILELKGNLASSEKLNNEQKDKIEALETTFAELKGNLQSSEQLINEQNTKIEEMEIVVDDLREQNAEQNNKIEDLEITLENQHEEILELKKNLASSEKHVNEQHKKIEEMEMIVDDLREQNAKQNNKIEALETIVAVNKNLQKDQLDELETSLQTLDGANDKKFQSQTEEIEDLRKEVTLAEQSLTGRIRANEEALNNFKSMAHHCYFTAYVRSTYTLTSSNQTLPYIYAVKFDRAFSNTNNCFNLTTHVFTAKITGLYFFTHSVVDPNKPGARSYLAPSHDYIYIPKSIIIYMRRGDQVYVRRHDFPQTVKYDSWFTGFLLKAYE